MMQSIFRTKYTMKPIGKSYTDFSYFLIVFKLKIVLITLQCFSVAFNLEIIFLENFPLFKNHCPFT